MHERTRAEVEADLGYRLPDQAWSALDEQGLVEDAYVTGDSWKLAKFLRQVRARSPRAARRGRLDLPPLAAGSTDLVSRARAFSELLADEVAKDRRVVRYRRRFLDGRAIDFAAVERLFASPAACLVPATVLESARVPLLAHESHVVREKLAGCGGPWPDCNRLWTECAVVFGRTETVITVQDSPTRRRVLEYHSRNRGELFAGVAAESPLGLLSELSDALGAEYCWPPGEAAAYVLEGVVPLVRPIEVSTSFHVGPHGPRQATITLAVHPSAPVAEVARAYRKAQLRVLPEPGRARDERTMAAVAFVAQRRREDRTATWIELMRAFNDHSPKRFTRVPVFIQAVHRGQRTMLSDVKLPRRLESWLPTLRRSRRISPASLATAVQTLPPTLDGP